MRIFQCLFYLIKYFPLFLYLNCLLSPHLVNRANGHRHRSPPLHDPECERCGGVGPAARCRMRPAHRAAQQQGRTVQETDGETGFSTGGTEASASLTEQEVLHERKRVARTAV